LSTTNMMEKINDLVKRINLNKYAFLALIVFSILFGYSNQFEQPQSPYKDALYAQCERMYEYKVKPLSGKARKGEGAYVAELEYGKLSEEEKGLLISDIKNDGFRYPQLERYRDEKHFCKDKIAIGILDKNPERVRIMIVKNRFDKEEKR